MRAAMLGLVLFLAADVSAQVCDTNCQVRTGSPFIAFTESEPTAVAYRVFVNNVSQNVPAQIANGFVEFSFVNGLASVGTYTLRIEIVMPTGTVLSTDPNAITVVKRTVHIKK